MPKSSMEKVVFAFWHLCAEELSQTSVIWIFYAIETLLGTTPGENRRALHERICLLLKPTEKQESEIKKNLGILYDYRSSLVHGGLQIYHPLQFESLDKAVDEKYQRLMGVAEFGFAILLIALQTIIGSGWRSPKFTQTLRVEDGGT